MEVENDKNVFEEIIGVIGNKKEASIVGAKFPVHPKYITMLKEWYPSAFFIHLTRDIRGIYASEKVKKQKSAAVPVQKFPLF